MQISYLQTQTTKLYFPFTYVTAEQKLESLSHRVYYERWNGGWKLVLEIAPIYTAMHY